MSSLLKRWGFGVDLTFNPGDTEIKMTRVGQAAAQLRQSFTTMKQGFSGVVSGLGQVAMVLGPIGLAFGAAVGKASQLAADLEAQKLTMRVLIGNAGEADRLMGLIRANAAATPFQEGDLIEGSKRLLRLTGSNVDRNMDLLKTMETMAALNPTKSVVDGVEALLDATSGGGFERLKEFGISLKATDVKGVSGSAEWAESVVGILQERLTKATRGEDLVKALSETFGGRMSTLGDAFAGGLRDAGERINERLGPMIVSMTERVAAMGPAFIRAVDLVAGAFDKLAKLARPFMDRIDAWWTGLGTDGQASIMAGAMAVGAFAAAAIPVGGVIAAVVTVVGGLVSALVALGPVLEGAGGVLVALAGPELLIPIAAGLAGIALAVAGMYAAFSEPGEGPLAFLMRIGEAIRVGVVEWFTNARIAASALWDGFSSSFGGFAPLIEAIVVPLRRMWERFQDLGLYLGGGGVNPDAWRMFGTVLGMVATTLVDKLAAGLEFVAALLDILMDLFLPFQAVIATFVRGLIGLVSGSMSVTDALKLMARSILGIFLALTSALVGILLGGLELMLRAIVTSLAGVPGMDSIFGATGNLGADALGRIRHDVSQGLSDTIAGVDTSAAAKAAAGSKAPVVTVNQGDTVVKSETTLKVDGKDLAKATGGAAVKAGQKSGRELPADSRGRVLRGNGTVTGLAPSEVF
jgi:hypothetical protein